MSKGIEYTTEIVSGGACGIDSCAKQYALMKGLRLTEILPEYEKYGRCAPLKRNDLIIEYSDMVIAFWNGKSRGTGYVIRKCDEVNKPLKIIEL